MVKELTPQEFEEFTKDGIVVVDFFAEWCMPCMMMIPVIEDLAEKFEGKVKFAKINVGDYEDFAQKHNVSSIPVFKILKDGKVVKEFTGSLSEEDFEEKINEFL